MKKPTLVFLAFPNHFKGVEAGRSNCLLIQLVPSIDHLLEKK